MGDYKLQSTGRGLIIHYASCYNYNTLLLHDHIQREIKASLHLPRVAAAPRG